MMGSHYAAAPQIANSLDFIGSALLRNAPTSYFLSRQGYAHANIPHKHRKSHRKLSLDLASIMWYFFDKLFRASFYQHSKCQLCVELLGIQFTRRCKRFNTDTPQ
jgi:hypothetical protein